MSRIVAATGHRPDKLGGYSQVAAARLHLAAANGLRQLEPSEVIVGMALGWDQAVGWACVGLGIPFIAAVPFEGQESRWPAESQRKFRTLLGYAKRVEIVCAGGYSTRAMQLRNEWMADRATDILACWDGSPGGTGNCLRYAKRLGLPILNTYTSERTK